MKKGFLTGLAVLAFAGSTWAAPLFEPFLKIDLNGESGPTQATWEGWNFVRTPLTNTFSNSFVTSEGTISVTIVGINNAGSRPQSRNRSGPDGGDDQYFSNMYRDFLYVPHDSAVGLGRDYFQITISGLAPNANYEITVFNYDQNHSPLEKADTKRMAWGVVNPAAWLDENFGAGQSYQPGEFEKRPPVIAVVPMAGPWPSDPVVNNPYAYAGSFWLPSDSTGTLTFYGWADLLDWEGTQHAPLNGLWVGVPEPASLALLAAGSLLIGLRRKV